MTHTGTICALSILAAACTALPPAPAPRALSLAIQPGKMDEECFALAAGERIDYQFQASAAVHFNLHTHRGNEIVMPVDVKRTREQAGIFASPRAEDYCMMWTNEGGVPAYVTGEWRRLRR